MINIKYAKRMDFIKASEIRETLKLLSKPEMISFAGGNPDPETFPVDVINEVTSKILSEHRGNALQYSPTEGYNPLRVKIVERMKNYGVETFIDNILITSGSQQGLSLTGDVFLNEGDIVICESPTYFGAINAFKKYLPKIIDVKTEKDGIDLNELEKVLSREKNVKLIYVIPDFQNPTGNSWSIEKRKKIVDLSLKYNVPIVEDNPYIELRFSGEKLPTIKHFDTDGNVIYLGSYSKTFCPGLRIGWINAQKDILNKYIIMKQGADLQTNTLAQRQLFEFLNSYDFDSHINNIKNVYKKRHDLMIKMINDYFPKDCKYSIPNGGFFIWVELPENIDGKKLLSTSIENNVAFISGSSFYPNGQVNNYIRLSYSTMQEDKITEGMRRLGKIIKNWNH